MYGAILGDIIGSPYEFDKGGKTKSFELFIPVSRFTDDSVMTIAVADALMLAKGESTARISDTARSASTGIAGAMLRGDSSVGGCLDDEDQMKELFIDAMQKWGHRYPNAGYGGRFYSWLAHEDRRPYNSFGNGSGMRVSPVGWVTQDLKQCRTLARWSAEVTHDHPEGIKGAEAIASAIFMARTGQTKEEIREYVSTEFGYDLDRTYDEIRPMYHFDVTCQGSVPEAIIAFLEGNDFEDVVRTAVSLGGDTDTIGAMAGSIAEAFYGVPEELMRECEARIPEDMRTVLIDFAAKEI